MIKLSSKSILPVILLAVALLFAFMRQGVTVGATGKGFVDIYTLPSPFCFGRYCATNKHNFWAAVGTSVLYSQKGEYLTSRELTTDQQIYGLYFGQSGKGWVVGGNGAIYYTSDNSRTWTRQQSGVTETLNAVTCINDRHCWVVGQDSVLFTLDTGLHWEKFANIPYLTSPFKAVEFVDSQTGWVLLHENEVLRTTDGGANWQLQKVSTDTNAINFFEDIEFVDRQTGYVTGWGGVARTTNGGKTWQTVLQGEELVGNGHFIGLVVQDAGYKVWAVGDEQTPNYCSTDTGQTWKPCGLKVRKSNISLAK